MRNKYVTIILLLTIVVFAYSQVDAQNLLSGEYLLHINYLEDTEELESISILNLSFDKSNWTTAYHLDLDYKVNLKDSSNDITLNEAYFDYYGEDFDLRIGQQVVNWGTAIEYNPTSNLNPLEEIGLMGDKSPIMMINGQYYIDRQYNVQGAIIPYHKPTMEEIYIKNLDQTIQASPIEDDLNNAELALKWTGRGINGFDFSLSYFRGFEDLPTAEIGFNQTPEGPAPYIEDVYYREVSIYGADIATSYKGVGLWTEGAYMVPEDGEEYSSAVIGADYKLENGVYLEGQAIYIKDKLENENIIIQTAIENTFKQIHEFRLGTLYNIETKGYLIKPEVEFSLSDATKLSLSYEYFEGKLLNNEMMNKTLGENGLKIELSYSF